LNNQTTPVTSTLLRNKLGRLVVRLQQQANPQGTKEGYETLERVVGESMKLLGSFYKQLSEPGYKPVNIVPDILPDAESFNNNFLAIQDDLITVFDEFENWHGPWKPVPVDPLRDELVEALPPESVVVPDHKIATISVIDYPVTTLISIEGHNRCVYRRITAPLGKGHTRKNKKNTANNYYKKTGKFSFHFFSPFFIKIFNTIL